MVHKLKALDLDEKPVLRYKIDRDASEAKNEDGAVVKVSEYDFMSAFELNAIDGTMKVSRIIDREKVEIIRLTVTVEDLAATKSKQMASGGDRVFYPRLPYSEYFQFHIIIFFLAILTIMIDDENDNSPMFRKPFYRRAVTENSQAGITTVSYTHLTLPTIYSV